MGALQGPLARGDGQAHRGEGVNSARASLSPEQLQQPDAPLRRVVVAVVLVGEGGHPGLAPRDGLGPLLRLQCAPGFVEGRGREPPGDGLAVGVGGRLRAARKPREELVEALVADVAEVLAPGAQEHRVQQGLGDASVVKLVDLLVQRGQQRERGDAGQQHEGAVRRAGVADEHAGGLDAGEDARGGGFEEGEDGLGGVGVGGEAGIEDTRDGGLVVGAQEQRLGEPGDARGLGVGAEGDGAQVVEGGREVEAVAVRVDGAQGLQHDADEGVAQGA